MRATENLHPASMLEVTVVGLLDKPPAWTHLGAKCCCKAKTNSTKGKPVSNASIINFCMSIESKKL